ncbi:MAG: dihydrodipicolinate synthase family protein [Clostridia bacterium]|nr:dihydrodipicolinate synthase family protein [Clostridia bacterium]
MSKKINGGVYPTMITPYTADNKIDLNGVEQILQWYTERGVDGIFAICQSSEIFFLSFEERLALLKFIMEHKPQGVNIVASGHTADDLDTQIEEAKHFIDCGIDAYVFISNRFAKADESDEVFMENMMKVCDALPGIDFGIYECPYPYKRLLNPEMLKEMVKTNRFRFIKDTCCNLDQLQAKVDAVKGSDLMIFNANAATFLESMKMGCSGYSGVMANFHPELYSELIANIDKDPAKAQKLQDIVGFFSVVECQTYPINAKYYMTLDGLDINITSRARNIADFPKNRALEIDQMHALTKMIKATL